MMDVVKDSTEEAKRIAAALERIATAQERLAVIGLMGTLAKDAPTALAGADALYALAGEVEQP